MKGKVYLIGAGPGDSGLITLKAVEALKHADTVVFDRLINPDILKWASPQAEFIDVGKFPKDHPVPQSKINHILYTKALEGKNVARLKGGDPFVFGRGGEEALYLKQNQIPFEIICGVTSAVAVPAYAGIPVTHRYAASSVHIITGHEKDGGSSIDFEALAKLEGTLVFLMGIKNLDNITNSLIKYGKSPDTPAAVIMKGTTPGQKTAVGTLSNIDDKVRQAGIKNPAVIVIGQVVNLRDELSWYEKGELFGKRILFLGTGFSDEPTPRRDLPFYELKQEGAEVIICPTLKISSQLENVKGFINEIADCDILIFTSKNGVNAFISCMKESKIDARHLAGKQIWAIGEKTGGELSKAHIYPDVVPKVYTSKALLSCIEKEHFGKSAAVITSNIGGAELIAGLENCGIKAKKITAYKNEPNFEIKEELLEKIRDGIDAAVFTSPSSFDFMRKILNDDMENFKNVKIAAIGPVTKAALEKAGQTVDIMPQEYTLEGLSRAILAYYIDEEGDFK